MRPRMLITRIGAFGDVCMLVPIVHGLQQNFEVDWLIRDCYKPVVQGFRALRCRTIGVNLAPDGSFSPNDPLITYLRSQQYDYCLDFSHWPVISRLVSHLSDIPIRAITHDPLQDALLGVNPTGLDLEQPFNCVVDVDPANHQIEKWQSLIRESCGLDLRLDWPLPPRRSPEETLRIFIHPHAGKPEKIWPASRFAKLLSTLARHRPVHCVINGARGSLARAIQWRLLFGGSACEILPFDPSFQRLRQHLQTADLAIGCDSGPMHLASLLGTPTMVIYGPYRPGEFGPKCRSVSVVAEGNRQAASHISQQTAQLTLESLVAQLGSASDRSQRRAA